MFLLLLSLISGLAQATPSSVFWTYCTTDTLETGIGHIDEDNYFTVFNQRGHGSAFAPDTGFELGMFSLGDVRVEGGVDYLGGADDPFYFNIGAGIDEGKVFDGAPSMKIGCFNIGTRTRGDGRTNQNIADLIIGKKFEYSGMTKVCLGGYMGSRAIGKTRAGFMLSLQQFFLEKTHCDGTNYYSWMVCGDYASGRNTIGGGGVGVYYYFTPDISIATGPVWFNSASINGQWKWSVQIDISFKAFEEGLTSFCGL